MNHTGFAPAAGGRAHPLPFERLYVDPDDPTARDFLLRELLLGTIRVVASGRGRVAILPSAAWFPGGSVPPAPDPTRGVVTP